VADGVLTQPAWWWSQVIGVMDAMPNSNLKPEGEDAVLESDRMYRTTYMFRCCSAVASHAACCCCSHIRHCRSSILTVHCCFCVEHVRINMKLGVLF
jgi:hypothetical protein